MATDKKSFLLYCDLIHTVEKLNDEKAGALFKHILRYVNDQNPTAEDFIIELAFEPIKQSLKRDLQRYEAIKERNRINGLRGGRPKNEQLEENPNEPKKPTGLSGNPKNPSEPKKADSDSDSDSGIDSDSDSGSTIVDNLGDKPPKFDFVKSFLDLGVDEQILADWILVRKTKKGVNSKTAFKGILNNIEKSGMTANECIKIAAERSWVGFDSKWINNEQTPVKNGQQAISTGAGKDYLAGTEKYRKNG